MDLDIKTIQKSISLLLVSEEQPLHIDVVLAIIYVYLLQHEIQDSEDVKPFISLRKRYLSTYRIIANSIKAKSYKDACFICYQHLKTIDFDKKKRCLESIKDKLKIIANIEDNGFLSFSDKIFPAYLSILKNATKIDDLPLESLSWDKENTSDSNPDNELDIVFTNATENMDANQNAQNQDFNLDDFKVLYCKLKSKGGRENCKYAWQWLLTQEEYEEITTGGDE